ncbi:putative bacteriocin export ABC transporter [Enterococcus sp. RIT-PI-f]|uniref:putative bacteriocin export ABC transporter n=1 Tax=Enterococcus sp. RIT-PI-f TaxID=1690244 RepID=UPI0006B92864|nr:putative bacteriocin export ABC transporter [Enterococcus sp. RIT-PI-f]KPG69481.1 peptide ABC transporter ATP-binding protein [Enterococcus sp. RIT-PI-f]
MIKIENLNKKFENRYLFSKTNVTFENGKVYALIGPSGSGKTTLLNILAQLEPYDDGKIVYHDQPLEKIKSHIYFRNELGYLFQNFGLLESQSIKENLDLGLIAKKLKKSEKIALEKEVLEMVHLDYLELGQKIYTLSGGEAQRVALAKTILKNPSLILADEPTAALDPVTSEEIMSILLSLRNESRVIIIATHNQSIWERADKVIPINTIANID